MPSLRRDRRSWPADAPPPPADYVVPFVLTSLSVAAAVFLAVSAAYQADGVPVVDGGETRVCVSSGRGIYGGGCRQYGLAPLNLVVPATLPGVGWAALAGWAAAALAWGRRPGVAALAAAAVPGPALRRTLALAACALVVVDAGFVAWALAERPAFEVAEVPAVVAYRVLPYAAAAAALVALWRAGPRGEVGGGASG